MHLSGLSFAPSRKSMLFLDDSQHISSISGRRSIRITTIRVLLDAPITGSVFVKILIDGEDTVYQQHFSDNSLELRWILDPFLVLHDQSRFVIQLCKRRFFWPKLVADAAMKVQDALQICSNLNGPLEVRLSYSPAITVEIMNGAENDQNQEEADLPQTGNTRVFGMPAASSMASDRADTSAEEPDPEVEEPTVNTEQPAANSQQYSAKTTDPVKSKYPPRHPPKLPTTPAQQGYTEPAQNTDHPSHNEKKPTQTPTQVAKAVAEAMNVYNSSSVPGVGISLRRIRLEKAINLLHQIERQCNPKELAEVKERLLVAQCELINLFPKTDMNKQDVNVLFFHIDEALGIWAWQRAHLRSECLDSISKLRATLSSIPDIARQCSHTQDIYLGLQTRLAKSSVASDPLTLPLRIEVSHFPLEETFHQAIRHYEAGRWAPAMSLLKSQDSAIDVLIGLEDVYENAENHSSTEIEGYEPGRAKLTRAEFDMQLAICQASQLIHTGDWHFKEAETGMAEDLMGRAQLAQDDYRTALLCVTGQDVELEGTALARLARFYAKVAKLAVPAHQLYLRAVQLAACLSPALPKGTWYKECVAAVQAHRDELEAQESKGWAARREPILKKLAMDIEKLRSGRHMSNREFAEFVFKAWPPKTDGAAEPPQDPLNPSRLSNKHLLKVIQRYHTDRNSNCGEEWLVLCEEISKELNSRYNVMKGAD